MQRWTLSRRLSTPVACAALGALTAVACGRSSPPADTSNAPATSSSRQAAGVEKDSCSLLDPKEVEAVLGASLATPPFLSRDGEPAHDGSSCEYQDANLHSIAIDVEWDGGAMAFKMYGAFQGVVDQTGAKGLVHLADGAAVAGEWDEARVVACCSFVALRGDQMVTIDVGGSKAPMAAAAKLADSALKRLDHVLPISGSLNVKSAVDFEAAHRPKRRDPCALVSRVEAEALVGKLAGEPQSLDAENAEGKCVYEHASEGAFAPTYVLKVRWTGGLSEFRLNNEIAASFAKGFTRSAALSRDGKEAIESSVTGDDLAVNPAWEIAHSSVMGLSAVKKDVLITIEPQGGRAGDAVKLMEKAMSKL
jgi:hypothetical protein